MHSDFKLTVLAADSCLHGPTPVTCLPRWRTPPDGERWRSSTSATNRVIITYRLSHAPFHHRSPGISGCCCCSYLEWSALARHRATLSTSRRSTSESPHLMTSACHVTCLYSAHAVILAITHAAGSRGGRVFTAVCLCVCLFFRTISQKPMQLPVRITNLDVQNAPRRVLETHLLRGQKVKGQGHKSQKSAGVGLCTLVGAGFF